LNNHFSFEGLKILDLFAGTGNISYEFASREVHQSLLMVILLCKFIKQVATEYDFNIAATKK
jgi:16S rRNA G966 N2-methylase RsmD